MRAENEQRFRTIYAVTRPQLLAYALRRTASIEDAADIVAETYEIAWRRIDTVPDGPGALLWLYVTARYVLANEVRRDISRRTVVRRLADQLSSAIAVSETDDVDGRLAGLDVLRSLAPEDREILMLASWEGLTPPEIAVMFKCSPVAARLRLHRARRRLARVLADVELTRVQPVGEIDTLQERGAC